MDKAKILRLLDEADDIVSALYRQGANKDYKCKSLREKLKVIAAEITAPPKSNADRIRQMTDEELADFICQISQCCLNDAGCSMCPIYDGCAQNVMYVETWIKQEVSEDAGTDD